MNRELLPRANFAEVCSYI